MSVENSILFMKRGIFYIEVIFVLVEILEKTFNKNEPIFISEILTLFKEYSRAYIFRLINKAIQQGNLVKFDTGIYYLPVENVIGISSITTEDVVNKKYIKNDEDVFGVYCGITLKNAFRITTQMPNTIEVVTNKETTRCRRVELDGRTIILRKSRYPIDKRNYNAYIILQLFLELKDDLTKDIKNSIIDFKKNKQVSNSDLIFLSKYFPAQVTKNLLYSGVLDT